ncbi:unnamed protein product, partial [Mesorhabditis belari]|uniref:Uncharacterized protein n=1 Tax=Mesorhabditis belari TaxID=2138241 RepID=A0AAF3FH86_9BILA
MVFPKTKSTILICSPPQAYESTDYKKDEKIDGYYEDLEVPPSHGEKSGPQTVAPPPPPPTSGAGQIYENI